VLRLGTERAARDGLFTAKLPGDRALLVTAIYGYTTRGWTGDEWPDAIGRRFTAALRTRPAATLRASGKTGEPGQRRPPGPPDRDLGRRNGRIAHRPLPASRARMAPEDMHGALDSHQATWLWRTMRAAESAGLDARDVARQALDGRTLEGARDVAAVIDARIRRETGALVPSPWRP